MAIVKLSAPIIRMDDGDMHSIAELADKGLITFTTHKIWGRGDTPHIAYCAQLPDGRFWEISHVAYQSRTGQKVAIERKPKKPAWIW